MKALGRAQKEVDALGLPEFKKFDFPTNLHFPNISTSDNKELEDFLTMYGGYKAYMETVVSDYEAIVGAYDAAFNEGYNTALYKVVKEYEAEGLKKPTREELRGEIITRFNSLKEQKRELINQKAILERMQGLLNTYTTAYQTVSRVVALRTYGYQV